MRRRIVAVDATAENGHRRASGLESAAVGLAVHASSEPADDDEPGRGELPSEEARDLTPVRRACAGADDRDCRPTEQLDLTGSSQEEAGRRIV